MAIQLSCEQVLDFFFAHRFHSGHDELFNLQGQVFDGRRLKNGAKREFDSKAIADLRDKLCAQ